MGGDDPVDDFHEDPETWRLDQELNIAAEVYGSEPKGIFAADLEGEELVERFRTLLGFDVMWEPPTEDDEAADPGAREDAGSGEAGSEEAG